LPALLMIASAADTTRTIRHNRGPSARHSSRGVALAVLGCELVQLMLDGFAEVIERALLVEEALCLDGQ
jgi:hypothetical protein